MEILYCDNHLLAVDKEAGLSTQPDLEEVAKSWIKEKYKKEGKVFLHPIHRLDKPTSGIVLFARTSKALSRLNAQMRERKIEKTYLAYVEGQLKQQEDILEHWHIHVSHKALISDQPIAGAKKAILNYRVLESKQENSLVEVQLITGRYHQIRAQFSHIGHPIVGDKKYGSVFCDAARIALHHSRLTCWHPIHGNFLILQKIAGIWGHPVGIFPFPFDIASNGIGEGCGNRLSCQVFRQSVF